MKHLIARTVLPFSISLVSLPALSAEPTIEQCLSANESSISLRATHKLLQARSELLTCVASSCPVDVQRECIRRMDQVTAAIPTLVFQASDGDGKDLSNVTVTMDGAPLADKLQGLAIAVDPGQHTFRLESAPYPAVDKQLLVHEGQKERHVAIVFGAGAGIGGKTELGAPIPATPQRSRTYEVLAISSAGLGAIGLGVGTFFGLKAMSRHDSAAEVCPQNCANEQGAQLWREATTAGNISTVGFVVGAAGLASAVTFWVLRNKSQSNTPTTQVGLAQGRIVLGGTW